MKKCDIEGCKKKATVFMKDQSLCDEHFKKACDKASSLLDINLFKHQH